MRHDRRGLLVTADGARFSGKLVGAGGVAIGEVVFNTSMTGYQEIITDPSYSGQVVVMTASHIGNYGIAGSDAQADMPRASGFVMRAMSRRDSNWRSEGSFAAYLHDHGVVALADADTRRLTRHIRDHGAQPAAMGSASESELADLARSAPSMDGRDLATAVSTEQPWSSPSQGRTRGRVVAIDLGMKRDIVRQLNSRGLEVLVMPAGATAADVLSERPDGVFISNGPGDPEPLTAVIETVAETLGKVPTFGICLGHQVVGLALGATTFKLPFGHHGGNHPVKRLDDGRVEITAQNHGFAVDLWSLSPDSPPERHGMVGPGLLPSDVATRFGQVIPTHQNLNDGTLEGVRCLDIPAFSIQYHPEAAPGPRDAVGLFDDFVELMGLIPEAPS